VKKPKPSKNSYKLKEVNSTCHFHGWEKSPNPWRTCQAAPLVSLSSGANVAIAAFAQGNVQARKIQLKLSPKVL